MAPRFGGEGEGKRGVGVPKGIVGQHWEGGGGLWLHEQCTTRWRYLPCAWCVLVVADPNSGLVVNLHNLRTSLVGWGRYVRLP